MGGKSKNLHRPNILTMYELMHRLGCSQCDQTTCTRHLCARSTYLGHANHIYKQAGLSTPAEIAPREPASVSVSQMCLSAVT